MSCNRCGSLAKMQADEKQKQNIIKAGTAQALQRGDTFFAIIQTEAGYISVPANDELTKQYPLEYIFVVR